MTDRNIFRHAVCLVAGVLLFAFGASRMISGPVEQVTRLMHATQQTQTAEAGR